MLAIKFILNNFIFVFMVPEIQNLIGFNLWNGPHEMIHMIWTMWNSSFHIIWIHLISIWPFHMWINYWSIMNHNLWLYPNQKVSLPIMMSRFHNWNRTFPIACTVSSFNKLINVIIDFFAFKENQVNKFSKPGTIRKKETRFKNQTRFR